MNPRRIKKLSAVIVVSVLLGACGGTVSRQIDDAARTTSGAYDGNWQAVVQKGARKQFIQNWEMTCGDMSANLTLSVKDGQASLLVANKTHTTNVDDDGKFRFEIPTEVAGVGLYGSDLRDGRITVIVTGDLDIGVGKGRWVNGIKSMGNYGCNTSIDYSKTA